MADYFKRVHEQTSTRFWINNVTRSEAQKAIDAGAVGCTQNPSYSWKMFSNEEEGAYAQELIQRAVRECSNADDALVLVQRELVRKIAEIFHPMFLENHGKAGYVSIQGNPFKEDKDSIIRYAHFNREAGENIMCKIPVTADGLEAIKYLAAEGIPINATEVMSVSQVLAVCEAVRQATRGLDKPPVIYFSLITGIFDEYLGNYVRDHQVEINQDILGQASYVLARKVYDLVHSFKYDIGIICGGARGLHHFTDMIGADVSITINWKGTADKLLEQDAPVVPTFFQPIPALAEDVLLETLPDFRKAYMIHGLTADQYEDFGPVVLFRSSFEKAWKSAVDKIQKEFDNQ